MAVTKSLCRDLVKRLPADGCQNAEVELRLRAHPVATRTAGACSPTLAETEATDERMPTAGPTASIYLEEGGFYLGTHVR